MARVTVEDCLARIPNRFSLVVLAAEHARQLATGSRPLIRCPNRVAVSSLREIANGRIRFNEDVETTVNQYMAEVKSGGLRPGKTPK